MMTGVSRAALVALVVLSAPVGCAYSSYQTAKMLPPGGTRIGFGVSNYRLEGSSSDGSTTAIEGTGSYGINDKLELGGKIAWFSEADTNSFDFLVSPKLSLVPGTLALTAQSGLFVSDADGTDNGWLTMPGVIYTYSVSPGADLNICGKLVAGFPDDFSDYDLAGAANVGFRWSVPNTRIAVFPEIGVLYDDDQDEGINLQFGVAFQFDLGPVAEAAAQPPPPVAPAPVPVAQPPPPDPVPVPEPAPTP